MACPQGFCENTGKGRCMQLDWSLATPNVIYIQSEIVTGLFFSFPGLARDRGQGIISCVITVRSRTHTYLVLNYTTLTQLMRTYA